LAPQFHGGPGPVNLDICC